MPPWEGGVIWVDKPGGRVCILNESARIVQRKAHFFCLRANFSAFCDRIHKPESRLGAVDILCIYFGVFVSGLQGGQVARKVSFPRVYVTVVPTNLFFVFRQQHRDSARMAGPQLSKLWRMAQIDLQFAPQSLQPQRQFVTCAGPFPHASCNITRPGPPTRVQAMSFEGNGLQAI